MNANLTPFTLDLPDALIAKLNLRAQAKGFTLEAWVTILAKQAISELPDDLGAHSDSHEPPATA